MAAQGRKRLQVKAFGGRGRKRALWVTGIYKDLLTEMKRLICVSVKLSPAVVRVVMIWILPVRCWSVAEGVSTVAVKLQHHQPLSRVADMIPVSGRIELRPRKGDGSMGETCHQRVDQPIWGADASRP